MCIKLPFSLRKPYNYITFLINEDGYTKVCKSVITSQFVMKSLQYMNTVEIKNWIQKKRKRIRGKYFSNRFIIFDKFVVLNREISSLFYILFSVRLQALSCYISCPYVRFLETGHCSLSLLSLALRLYEIETQNSHNNCNHSFLYELNSCF